ncbi:MAG: tRNA threonylcarbamoyladenosine biosynthesis protein TsaB [Clostridia bacterium]
MKILAISTSSKVCSVALLDNDVCIKELNIIDEKTHSENLLPLIDKLLKETNVDISDIELIACDNGPRFFYRY